MEKRKGQITLVLVLVLLAVCVSIGFSAFSNTLKIQSGANVSPDASTLNVDFSSAENSVVTNAITPVLTPSNLVATDATIDNTSSPIISNLSATFTEPGQKAVYDFYAVNAGELKAYLKSIVYENVTGSSVNKVCTAKTGTTDALVQSACNGISVKVKVGSESEVSGGLASITGHMLDKNASEKITVTLEYGADAERADGDFTVSFGDIALNYSSVD